MHLEVSRASDSAIKAVEAAGGTIVARYYTATTLRALVKPQTFLDAGKLLPRPADPSDKRDLSELLSAQTHDELCVLTPPTAVYYSDPRKRGYLALRPVPALLPRVSSAGAATEGAAFEAAKATAAAEAAAAALTAQGDAAAAAAAPAV